MKNDLQRAKLKGHVKSYTEISYLTPDTTGKVDTSMKKTSITDIYWSKSKEREIFDADGFRLEMDLLNLKDSIVYDSSYQYIYNNNRSKRDDYIKSKTYPFHSALPESCIFINKYGVADSVYKYKNDTTALEYKSIVHYMKDGSFNAYTYYYYEDRTETTKDIVIKDRQGNVVSSSRYDEGRLMQTQKIAYDKKGNILSRVTENYKEDNTGKFVPVKTNHRYLYDSFDKAGNWLQCRTIGLIGKEIIVSVRLRQYTYY